MMKRQTISCTTKLKALADPTRLAVVQALMQGPKYVNELGSILKVEQSLLSHHLQVLRKMKLVEPIRDGKSIAYQLTAATQTEDNAIQLGCCSLSFPSKR